MGQQDAPTLADQYHFGAPNPAQDEDFKPQRNEFLAIAQRLFESKDEYVGYGVILEDRILLAQPDLSPTRRLVVQTDLALQLLRFGRTEEAKHQIDAGIILARSDRKLQEVLPGLHRVRALIALREAERQNCIRRHNADCCLFPLRGAGVHSVRGPAESARQSYLQFLELRPKSLRARWLLNLTAMALDDYPNGVPAQYRIPPQAFASDYDLPRFMDIAPQLGLDTFNQAGGVIVEDFDLDGLLDIVTSTIAPDGPLTYYRNSGNGRFEDRSAASRLNDQLGGLNCIATDYDNDGDTDVLVLRGAWMFHRGQIRNSLLRNNADGTFTDVTRRAGLAEPAYPTQAAAWADFDNDGDLDLYVGNESQLETVPAEDYPCQLFRNNGDNTFTDVAAQAGVTNDRYAKSVAAGDYDNDGDMDLYVSNMGPNRLYRNNADGTFTDVAETAGVIEPTRRSFTSWFFDYDNDGWLDLFVSGYDATVEDIAAGYLGLPHTGQSPRLYRNLADGSFEDVTTAAGLDRPFLPMGANFGDLDNDGFLDFYLGTGDPDYETLTPNVMMRNDSGRRFQDVTTAGGFGHLQKGHGIGFADFDHDGDQDIYHQLGGFFPDDKFNNAFFLNPGFGNHFLIVKLVGTSSNRSAVGARIKLVIQTPDGDRQIHRAVGCVSSFGGSPLRQEIGLSNARSIKLLEVWWPRSKLRQRFHDLPVDRMIRITEGKTKIEPLPMQSFDLEPALKAARQAVASPTPPKQ